MIINPKTHLDGKQNTATILFVDDEKQELKYFKRALNQEFSIKTANSVDNAIAILDQYSQEIAVVISDQRMPHKPGMELLRYTKENHPHVIRMLTTAYCDMANSIDAINQAEVFRYIAKPWNIGELSKNINQALKRYYKTNTNSYSQHLDNADKLLLEFNEDCQHWLKYALQAYGNIDIYLGGIEAFSCKYYARIHNNFELDEAEILSISIKDLLDKHFINESTLLKMQTQNDSTSCVSDTFGIKVH